MRPRNETEAALFLTGEGFNQSHIARWMGVPRSTVRYWIKPSSSRLGLAGPQRCSTSTGFRALPTVTSSAYTSEMGRSQFFSQVCDDIRELFCDACDRLGIRWRQNRWNSISIARAPSVALMDSFIGPKA